MLVYGCPMLLQAMSGKWQGAQVGLYEYSQMMKLIACVTLCLGLEKESRNIKPTVYLQPYILLFYFSITASRFLGYYIGN
jgi:hypothetical protein